MDNNNQTELKARQVVSLLRKFHEKKASRKRTSLITLFVCFLLIGLSILILFESSYYLSATIKIVSLILFFVLSAISVFRLSKKYRESSFKAFYENFFSSEKESKVLSAIDLYLDDSQKKSRFYQAAISANLRDVDTGKLSTKLKNHVENSKVQKLFLFSSTGFLFSLVLAGFVVLSMPAESLRTVHFWNGYTQPNPYVFTITPADTTVEHGSTSAVSIRYQNGLVPEETVFEFKTAVEESYRQRQMQQTDPGIFQSSGIDLTNDISYRVAMDGFYSDEYTIDVQLQPRFEELTATVSPPSYTQLSVSEYQYPFSEINLYPGSEINFVGRSNKPIEFISVNVNNRDLEMELIDSTEHQYRFSFRPEKTDTLTFMMMDVEGLSNNNPFRTLVNVQEDQYPVVQIQEPMGTVMKTEPSNLQIIYEATDDFGLSRSQLVWSHERAFAEEANTGSMRLETPANGTAKRVDWNLGEFDLRPRDRLQFSIRVWDNDAIAGAKMSESQQVMLQIPSLTEYFDELDNREDEVQSELDEVSEQFQNIENEYQEFLEQLRRNPQAGFEEEQMLEEIRKKQQQIDETVRNLNENFQQLSSEIEQNGRVSQETQQAYRELQQLMDELDDPALREAMEELYKALEELSPQELEQALENVEFNEKLYRERLKRTVELFKRLKMNSDLDKLARQFEDMAERMSPNENRSLEQLSDEMKTVDEDMKSVSDQLEQLDSNPPQNAEQRLKDLKESSSQELDSTKSDLNQLQEQADSTMQNGESSPNEKMQQQQQQISENLQSQAEKFRSSIQQMSGQQLQVNMLALQRSLYTLLELSEMQEFLSQSVSDTRSRSQGFVDLARIQQNVNDQFDSVADTLYEVSSELPGIPNQINRKKADVERRLSQSMEQMVERNQRGATVSARESLGGINDLTSMIASLIDQLMNQQGGGGMGKGMSMQQMVQQLQDMSGNQQQLNQQLQQMINDVQGDRLTREQSERLDQIARQQNEIRKQLRELQQNGALQQGDRMLSELQRMMEDMEDSINDMRGGVTDPLMVERQQNILSRMLSAEDAMQKRGEKDEREGTTSTEFERVLPPDITLEELQQEIRARMQDPNFTRFSEKYQRLIEQYFERLRRLEQESLP